MLQSKISQDAGRENDGGATDNSDILFMIDFNVGFFTFLDVQVKFSWKITNRMHAHRTGSVT